MQGRYFIILVACITQVISETCLVERPLNDTSQPDENGADFGPLETIQRVLQQLMILMTNGFTETFAAVSRKEKLREICHNLQWDTGRAVASGQP